MLDFDKKFLLNIFPTGSVGRKLLLLLIVFYDNINYYLFNYVFAFSQFQKFLYIYYKKDK